VSPVVSDMDQVQDQIENQVLNQVQEY
jgi:hypothetical protein